MCPQVLMPTLLSLHSRTLLAWGRMPMPVGPEFKADGFLFFLRLSPILILNCKQITGSSQMIPKKSKSLCSLIPFSKVNAI